jgi:hypothetical protein
MIAMQINLCKSRRFNMKTIQSIKFLLGAVLAFTAMSAQPISTASGDKPFRIIRLIERIHDVSFQDANPTGPSLGDRIIFTSNLFDEKGHHVGQDGADCVIVRIDLSAPLEEQQIVQCVITVELFSEGQLTFQSLAQGTENFFALTGGTGGFRTARGEAFARDITPLVEAEITITLFR